MKGGEKSSANGQDSNRGPFPIERFEPFLNSIKYTTV